MPFIEIIPRTSSENTWDSTGTSLISLSTLTSEPFWLMFRARMSPPQVWGLTPTFELSLGLWPCHSSLPALCLWRWLCTYAQRAVLCSQCHLRAFRKNTWEGAQLKMNLSTRPSERWVFWGHEIASCGDKNPRLLRKVHSKENHIRVREKRLKCNKV